jgi:transposase InsO family protein
LTGAKLAAGGSPVAWKETRPVAERFKFVLECEKQEKPIAVLCREFGISRQTGYKWLARYREDPCPEMLEDRSRRPLRQPHETSQEVIDGVIAARKRYPHWGPRKLRVILQQRWPDVSWPASSTIGQILKRRGLVQPRRRRRRTPPYTKPFGNVTAPNQLWCIDFKGHFKTGDGTRVYPLTITDAFSRFIIRCDAVRDPRSAEVRDILESAFREFGLPQAIRSDNGPPFASTGPGGLTELSAWWIKLGLRHERIDPGKPQQNGRHERMHLTLKRETASPPATTLRGQQGAFDRFRKQFNQERPREALGFATPASLYAPSARLFSDSFRRDNYPFQLEHTLVDKRGYARWDGRNVFIGAALRHELVDLRPVGKRRWAVCFGPIVLGHYDPSANKRALILQRSKRKPRISNGAGDAHSAIPVDSADAAHRAAPAPHSHRADRSAEQKRVSTMSPV